MTKAGTQSPVAWLDEIELQRPLNPAESRVKPWLLINGDKTLRINYPLSPSSVVYDVGGYEGDWAADIYQKYKCNIEIFEPVQKFSADIKKRFASKPKIRVHSFGLADKSSVANISLEGASSSTFKSTKDLEKIELVKVADFINQHTQKIDLMKINIEGGEYPLLEHLIKSGNVKIIKDLQVQFHLFVPNAMEQRLKLQKKLSKTHYLTYSYPFIWENWRLR